MSQTGTVTVRPRETSGVSWWVEPALGLCIGALGGAVQSALLANSVVRGVLCGAIFGLVFGLFFAQRATSPGAGLIWGSSPRTAYLACVSRRNSAAAYPAPVIPWPCWKMPASNFPSSSVC